jgi:hypothetical protein
MGIFAEGLDGLHLPDGFAVSPHPAWENKDGVAHPNDEAPQ